MSRAPVVSEPTPQWRVRLNMVIGRVLFAVGYRVTVDGRERVPVTRGSADRGALTAALGVLHAGGAVGIFPEGTRGRGDVAAVQQGAAWLALQGHAPVVARG